MTTILEGMSKLDDWPVDESTGKPAYCLAQDIYSADEENQHTVYAYTDKEPLACEVDSHDGSVIWNGITIEGCVVGDFVRFEDCDQNFVTHDQWLIAKTGFPPPSDSDWAKAPADATHWFPDDPDWFARWGKFENGKWYTYHYQGPGGTGHNSEDSFEHDEDDSEYHNDLINRGMFKLRPENIPSSTSTEENNVDAWL